MPIDWVNVGNLASRMAGDPYAVAAASLAPNGRARLVCAKCQEPTEIVAVDIAVYLRNGWPKHCGQTMQLETEATPAETEMDVIGGCVELLNKLDDEARVRAVEYLHSRFVGDRP